MALSWLFFAPHSRGKVSPQISTVKLLSPTIPNRLNPAYEITLFGNCVSLLAWLSISRDMGKEKVEYVPSSSKRFVHGKCRFAPSAAMRAQAQKNSAKDVRT